jgi:anti-sigma factor RsiW
MEGRSLFFVLGRGGPPDAAVRAANGQVVTRLPDQRRVLAVAPLDAYAALSRHPAVALAGPVSIDAKRFGSFAKLVGLDASPQET